VVPVVFAAIAALLFLQAVVRLRRRGRADLAGWDRVALFAAGLGVTLFALVGPLDRIADEKLLSAHMAQHVLIGDLGPALMVTALRGPLLVFFLPAPILAPLARNARVRSVLGTLLRPRVAFGIWVYAPSYPDPADYSPFLPGKLIADHFGWRIGSDPPIEKLATKALLTTQPAARRALYEQIQRAMNARSPLIPLLQPAQVFVATTDLTGAVFSGAYGVDVTQVSPS